MSTENRKLTSKDKSNLAEEIIAFLYENNCFEDIALYTDGKCYTSYPRPDYAKINRPFGTFYMSKDDVDVIRYVGCANPETLTMTFEGSFNPIINCCNADSEKIINRFNLILAKYNIHYEQSDSWQLVCYYNG